MPAKVIKDRHTGKKRTLPEPKVYQPPPEKRKALERQPPIQSLAENYVGHLYKDHKEVNNIIKDWINQLSSSIYMIGGTSEDIYREEKIGERFGRVYDFKNKIWTSGMQPVYRKVKVGTQWIHRYRVKDVKEVLHNEGETLHTKFHGTGLAGAFGVLKDGRLKPSYTGLLGPGVYVANKMKASGYIGKNFYVSEGVYGVLFQVKCAFGTISDSKSNSKADTIYGVPGTTKTWGGTLHNEEWCIRDPERVAVEEITFYQRNYKE